VGTSDEVGRQAQVALNEQPAQRPPTPLSHDPANGGRRRERGVALLGVALLVGLSGLIAGCSPTTPTAGPSGVVTSQPPVVGASGDAAARLSAVLGQLAAGYSFTSTVKVGGQVATQAKGRWVSGASEFTVTTNGVSITYRTLPPRSWVLQSGAGWVEVNGNVPSGNPLDALKAPGQIAVLSDTSAMLELTASYPAAVLGLAGSSSVAVDLVLAPDGSLKASYAETAGNATSVTSITPNPSQAPIAAPSPS
jgi:hypothetical protein